MFNLLILNIMHKLHIQHLANIIYTYSGEHITHCESNKKAVSDNYIFWFDDNALKIFGNPTNSNKLAFTIELPANSESLAHYL